MGNSHPSEQNIIKSRKEFKASLDTNIKLSQARLNILKTKKINAVASLSKEIAILLQDKKVRLALIKTESLIRLKNSLFAAEDLLVVLESLKERIGLLDSLSELPAEVKVHLATIGFCENRMQVDEFQEIRKAVQKKFGPEVDQEIFKSESLVAKKYKKWLSVETPPKTKVNRLLAEIARDFEIAGDWKKVIGELEEAEDASSAEEASSAEDASSAGSTVGDEEAEKFSDAAGKDFGAENGKEGREHRGAGKGKESVCKKCNRGAAERSDEEDELEKLEMRMRNL